MSVYPKDRVVQRYAEISSDGQYRYVLIRSWAKVGEHAQLLSFIMLNPSTADGEVDDQTIWRCVGLAVALGYTGIRVVNLFAYRTPKPVVLWKAMDAGVDVVGPYNDELLETTLMVAHSLERPVAAAWGAAPRAKERVAKVCAMPYAERLHAFMLTASGAPRHPLYLPRDRDLTPWESPSAE